MTSHVLRTGSSLAILLAFLAPTSATTFSGPAIGLSATSLSFTGKEGGHNPVDKHVSLTNTGDKGTILQWTATSSEPWLTVNPASGNLGTGPVILQIKVNMTYQVEGWVGATSTVNAPSPRRIHSAVWAANRMIVWGGSASPDQQYDDGALYDPVTNTWTGTTSMVGAPTARQFHTAVWTGAEMIVWGGWSNQTSYVATGAKYFPDGWLGATSTVNAPERREAHSAVWTGSEMIIWGGYIDPERNTGARYDPTTDAWTGATSLVNAPEVRQEHVGVWTGSRMMVWGGRHTTSNFPFGNDLNTGAFYDPVTDSWTGETSMTGALEPRVNPSVVWTGKEVIVWGGYNQDAGGIYYNTGKRFNPVTNTWLKPLPTTGAPSPRLRHRAVWTGTKMIVWGGEGPEGALNTGAIYQPPIPSLGTQQATITITAPGATNSPQTITVQLTVQP
jgi:hypothetical protein